MSRIRPSLADGRCFTSYLASCHYDQHFQGKFATHTEPAFRQYLQSNGLAAQDETRKLHVCAFAFDTMSTGPKLSPAPYAAANLREF